MTEENLKPYSDTENATVVEGGGLGASDAVALSGSRKALARPYTIVVPKITRRGQEFDACYLVYKGKRLPITASEYALLQVLIGDGYDLKEASAERHALKKKKLGGPLAYSRNMTAESADVLLFRLRDKIAEPFPDLVIPLWSSNSKGRLRLWTKDEIDRIWQRIINPSDGADIVTDEKGFTHLLVNGHEVRPQKNYPGIGPQHLALASMLLVNEVFGGTDGVRRTSKVFSKAWRQITGKKTISRASFKMHMSGLRGAFRILGWTLNCNRKTGVYQLMIPPPVPKPYTTIGTKVNSRGNTVTVYHLVYGTEKLPLSLTEYALLEGGLLEGGLDLEKVGDIRHRLEKGKSGNRQAFISDGSARRILDGLRRKLESTFPDLTIPIQRGGHKNQGRLRLLTRNQIAEIRDRIANPHNGVFEITDEFGRRRLFVNRKEIQPDPVRPGITPQYYVLASILFDNAFRANPVALKPNSAAFRARWERSIGKEEISPKSFGVHKTYLNRAFMAAGLTISTSRAGDGSPVYKLIPFQSAAQETGERTVRVSAARSRASRAVPARVAKVA